MKYLFKAWVLYIKARLTCLFKGHDWVQSGGILHPLDYTVKFRFLDMEEGHYMTQSHEGYRSISAKCSRCTRHISIKGIGGNGPFQAYVDRKKEEYMDSWRKKNNEQ